MIRWARARLRPCAKTYARTQRYLTGALLLRPSWRDQALVAWGMVAAAVWFAASVWQHERPPGSLPILFGLLAVLTAIAAIDARWGIIPDGLVAAVFALGLVAPDPAQGASLPALSGAAVVFVSGYALHGLYRAWRGYDGFGLGDVKLAAAAVPWVGLDGLSDMIVIAVGSALASLALLRCETPLSRRDAVAFGPHLVLGLAFTMMLRPSHLMSLLPGMPT